MGKKILNFGNCDFKCPNMQPPGKFLIVPPVNFCHDGEGEALTVQAKISGVGICTQLTAMASGVPTPCAFQMMSNWLPDGIEMMKRVNGHNLLNDKAKQICPVCGMTVTAKLKMQKPVVGLMSVVLTGGLLTGGNSDSQKTDGNVESSDSPASETETKNESQKAVGNNNDENMDSAENDIKENQEQNPKDEKTEENSEKIRENKEAETDKSEIDYTYALKECRECRYAEECEYLKTPHELSEKDRKNASKTLRENARAKSEDFKEKANRVSEEIQRKINNVGEAHHLVSIKDIYGAEKKLVKLGNFYGYDINNGDNCIILPSAVKDGTFGGQSAYYKEAEAFEVMSSMGLQWHAGQHSYSLSGDDTEEILRRRQIRLQSYSDELKEYLDNQIMLKRVNRWQCAYDDPAAKTFSQKKKRFIDMMNQFSEHIEEHLLLFGGDPKDSYPYFVSLVAVQYTYGIMTTGRFAKVVRRSNGWEYQIYRYKKYQNTDNRLEISQEESYFYQGGNEELSYLINICQNVRHFFVYDDGMCQKLPFEYLADIYYVAEENDGETLYHGGKALEQRASGFDNTRLGFYLALSVIDNKEKYVCPAAVVMRRRKECGLL